MAKLHEPDQTVERYVRDVLSGRVVAGKLVRQCVQRHVDDLRTARRRGLRFDRRKARHAIEWFSYLTHSMGEWAGQPFRLEPWQMFIVWCVFGWLRADGTRRFRTLYLEVGRKNGKSTLAAGLGLLLAFADDERGARVYSAATKKEQAIIVHSEATRMVKSSPDLRNHITVYKHHLSRAATNSSFEPLGADEDRLDGLQLNAAIVDELHAHKTRGLWDVLVTGMGHRRQPLMVALTTAGVDQSEASICWEQHGYAEQVLTGVIEDDSYFAFIATLDEGDDWHDETVWLKANPNLGVTVKLEWMREMAGRAAKLPGFLNSFLRFNLNRWTNQTTRWIGPELWAANAGTPIDEASLQGRICYGGLDLSAVSDLTAWVLLFPDPAEPGRVDVLCRFWCPEARVTDEHNRYRPQYEAWVRDGWLAATPGNAIDYQTVKAQVLRDAQAFELREICIDRLFQGYQLAMELAEEGLTVAACGMGFLSMAAPTAELERRLLQGQIHHGGHPVLRWMANNVAVKMDPAGNRKPDKASSQGKIDGIVALLLALDRVMRHQAAGSIYEQRGFFTLGAGGSPEPDERATGP